MNEKTQESEDREAQDLEIIGSSALEQMERASIDVQVATAKRYPRVLSVVKAQMLSFATLDQDTAAGCFYTLPIRKGGDKPIQGPSVRMAEIALSSFQNLRAASRIISDDGRMVTAQAVCHDLQNNVLVSVEVKRRVTTKEGKRYSDDMVVVTSNAACAIAFRNATFKVIPLALVKPVYEAAKRVAIGDAKTLSSRRSDAVAHFKKMGVPQARILAAVGARTVEDIDLDGVGLLLGLANAIKDKEVTIDEAFPEPEAAPKTTAAKPSEPVKQSDAPILSEDPQDFRPVEAAEEPALATSKQTLTPQQELAVLVNSCVNGSFDTFRTWAEQLGVIPDCTGYGSWAELPTDACGRLLKAQRGVVSAMGGKKP